MRRSFQLFALGLFLLSNTVLFGSVMPTILQPGHASLFKTQSFIPVAPFLPAPSPLALGGQSLLTVTVTPHNGDSTAMLQNIFSTAPAGATINFLPGTYTVAAGTTFILMKPLTLSGIQNYGYQQVSGQVTLVNARILSAANISINGINFIEQDCTYTSSNPSACPIASPMITLGASGYPITQASISNVTLQYTRAYSGIVFGLDKAENISISNFSITDHQLSGITALGGNNIRITNGTITGGIDVNVDDGIALYSATGELSNVTISNVIANNTADLIGIGSNLYYPTHDITISNSWCQQTIVCIYVKAGDSTPAPAPFSGYSQLQRLTINGITDFDLNGTRHFSTIWIYGKGGASVSGISISNVNTLTRSATLMSPNIWIFTDAASNVSNVQFTSFNMMDRFQGASNSSSRPGFPSAEGLYLVDQGYENISNVALKNVNMNGASYYAIDSSQAVVSGLSITNSSFLNFNVANPGAPLFLIPYPYLLNGNTVQ